MIWLDQSSSYLWQGAFFGLLVLLILVNVLIIFSVVYVLQRFIWLFFFYIHFFRVCFSLVCIWKWACILFERAYFFFLFFQLHALLFIPLVKYVFLFSFFLSLRHYTVFMVGFTCLWNILKKYFYIRLKWNFNLFKLF